jgi:hypothetical protein
MKRGTWLLVGLTLTMTGCFHLPFLGGEDKVVEASKPARVPPPPVQAEQITEENAAAKLEALRQELQWAAQEHQNQMHESKKAGEP